MRRTKEEQAEAVRQLRRLAPIGTKIYGVVRKVSASGMSRTIDFYVVGEDRELHYLTGWMACALGWSMDKHRGMRVSGCGMDMVFHSVHSCASAVWHDTPEYAAWKAAVQKSGARNAPTSTGYVWSSEVL